MNKLLGLVAGAGSLALATAAQALPVTGEISLSGYAAAIGSVSMASATGIDFVANANGSMSQGVAGGITAFGNGTGSLAGLSCSNASGSCGSIKDLLNFSSGSINSFLTLYDASGTTVSFDVSSVAVTSRDAATNTLVLTASGMINQTNYSSTAGTFTLTAKGDHIQSFQATAGATPTGSSSPKALVVAALDSPTAIPEPTSMLMLGGSLAAIGLVRRKKA